jgi:glycosyltransferase involved in cell wall biosynthesis
MGVQTASVPGPATPVAPPSFSVIIAAYQAAAFVGDAVRSALDQDPPPLEVIVGDDGSTDDLRGALAEFGSQIRCVRIDHAGEAAAKNAAAAAAVGDFLAFLDADDRFLPGRLATLGAFAAQHPDVDIITTDAYLVHKGEIVGRCYGDGHRFASSNQREAILQRNFVLGLAGVKRPRFADVGGFDTSILYTTDWDLWLRLIFTGSRVALIPEPLGEYRLHADAASTRRAAMSRGRLETLSRAAARTDLTAREREILDENRRRELAVLAREELRETLLGVSPTRARREAARIVVSSHQPASIRIKALAALIAPGVARRQLQGAGKRSFVTVGDRRLPR